MITVAVAGGTSPGLGRSILEGLKQYPDKLNAIVLSREGSKVPQWMEDLEIEVRSVNYKSATSLKGALGGVHTVICTMLVRDGTWASTQINLLNAAVDSGVERFAPAEFGPGPLAAHSIDILAPQIEVRDACREMKEKNPGGFEYAAFHVGAFMNYLGVGSEREEDALHGFDDNWRDVWWHIKEMKAEIPLTKEGKVPRVTMTEIRDVGRLVAAACLLPKGKWEENFSMAGETLKMTDIINIAENVRGKKMEVNYRSFEQVLQDKEKEEDFYRKFWYELEEMNARDTVGEGIVEPILNKLCPNVKPLGVAEYVKKYWS